MFNLKLLLILPLISYSLQDSNCLITYETCVEEEFDWNMDIKPKKAEKISNCEYEFEISGDTYCSQCKNGFAASYDRDSCISFENCEYLWYGNEECFQCKDGYALSYDHSHCVSSFPNCERLEYEDKNCSRCYDGYLLSNDKKRCVSFPNCEELGEEDSKCAICKEYFHNNTEGKCERTLCSNYENDICTNCYPGYYLKEDKKCEKIDIQYCLAVSDSDPNECTSCVGNLPIVNKKCVIPGTLVKGCIKYNDEGKCIDCTSDYDYKDNNCKFKGCSNGEKKDEYCGVCKTGFYLEDGLCTSYKDGSKDTSSVNAANIKKIQYVLIILILALLI